ncbi:hypothetical protein D7Y41_02755 [Anaerotruncus sp. 1XD22-93]|nr:hypothetical protein [Lachnospiraceae bacterium]NBI74217.1 hypothetical protein [Lachnospiraceae bacterium]RKK00394.1 hypothetical protein D7Y41_02755 [Anaerotruncus sp. 1XD22-93]
MKKHCFTCGGHGLKDKVCPECGLKHNSMNLDKKPVEAKKLVIAAKKCLIPAGYTGVEWNEERLRMSHQERAKDQLFLRFVAQLDKVHSIFASGRLPAKSAIFIAPPQHSKMTFAYSCMQLALMHGFKVAPLLDSLEVKRLLVLAAERPQEIVLGIPYEEYVNADVVFITITKTTYRNSAYQIIQEMLDKRSRKGLPTFFLSRYNMATLSAWDSSKSFDYVKDYNNTENSLKYPAIINCWVRDDRATKGV